MAEVGVAVRVAVNCDVKKVRESVNEYATVYTRIVCILAAARRNYSQCKLKEVSIASSVILRGERSLW